MPYFALIIMFYHVKITCYQCSSSLLATVGEIREKREEREEREI